MVDFNFKESFPIQAVIDAAQRNNQLQEAARQAGNQSLIEGLKSIGAIGQNIVDQRLKMAQALSSAQLLAQTDEGKKLMGNNPIASIAGHTITPNMTAQGTDASGEVLAKPVSNQSPVNERTLATAMMGLSPKDLLSQLFQKNVNQNFLTYDKDGNLEGVKTIKAPKGSSSTVIRPTPEKTGTPMASDRAGFKFIGDFNSNPQVRRQQQSIDAANSVRDLATSGNPIAAGAIPTYMARASGEVGNLSEADKAPFGGTRAILQKMQAALTELSTGKLTQANQQFLLDLADIMETNAQNNLDRKGREISNQYSTVMGNSPEELFGRVRPGRFYEQAKLDKTSGGWSYVGVKK